MAVQGLGGDPLALNEYVAVEVGQDRAVEAHRVLHEEYHLNAGLLDVVLNVHLVLDELDDGEDKVGIAKPAEYIVEHRQVLILHAARDAVGERSQHYAMDVGETSLDVTGNGERIVVGIAGHTEHKVHIGCHENLLGLING